MYIFLGYLTEIDVRKVTELLKHFDSTHLQSTHNADYQAIQLIFIFVVFAQ